MTIQLDGSAGITLPSGTQQLVGGGNLIKVRLFTIANSGQTYVPTLGTKSILIEAVAGGGGSGSIPGGNNTQLSVSTGGSGGGYVKAYLTTGFTGITMTIGAGGAGGAVGAAGSSGGDTSFGTLFTCIRGSGGSAGTLLASGATAYYPLGLSIGSGSGGSVVTTNLDTLGAPYYIVPGGRQACVTVVNNAFLVTEGGGTPLGSANTHFGYGARPVGFSGSGTGLAWSATPGSGGGNGAIIVYEYA